jgi:Ser/Thr protein kinase RdoA (MazF antagonist)
MSIPEKEAIVKEVMGQYDFPGTVEEVTRNNGGHINDTFTVVCKTQEGETRRFILQGLSLVAFPRQKELMENFIGVTSHLRKKIEAAGGDPMRETLNLVYTRDGKPYYTEESGKVWRVMPFVEGTLCLEKATPELFEASARAFGRFQGLLADYPAETLHETIVKFHDTEDRFAKFLAALEADKVGRAKEVQKEVQFVMDRKADCSVAVGALREGKLPLKVTHNDTKLSNILIDETTMEGICVIDLDTTMPGLSIYDFGDSIRFGANHCAEDEKDLSKVNFDIELYKIYARGFLEGAQGGLTDAELEYLPWGAKLMTLECGIRFLTDYLDGDNYFRIHYPEQNLDRCRTQFKLVADMENQWDAMHAIIRELAK